MHKLKYRGMIQSSLREITMHDLKSCPFCGFEPPTDDLIDILHPSGIYWRPYFSDDGVEISRSYVGHQESKPGDQQVWTMNCTENMGGCGAEISADTLDEVIKKWNRRVTNVAVSPF